MLNGSIDGVFLDMYGTLTSGDRAAVERVCGRVVADAGLSISAGELSVMWGERFLNSLDFCNGEAFETLFDLEIRTLRETMANLNRDIDPVPYAEALRDYWQNPPLQDDARAFIASCPVPICIVSNADHEDVEAVVRQHALDVAGVVSSEEAKSYKPDHRIFEHALRKTGWRRDRVVHCGDSLHSDIGGAIAAGIRNVWLNRAHRIHDIGTHEPHHEAEDLHEFLRLLQVS
ncbi:MAG: HAD family hydrolase [Phycisphaerales bacterium]|nr:HAD family hydrolase [Phycisphaerales bacterium]MCB9864216.1 HAD family hydrolase [Phycisphaerales bacterium]